MINNETSTKTITGWLHTKYLIEFKENLLVIVINSLSQTCLNFHSNDYMTTWNVIIVLFALKSENLCNKIYII